MFDLFWCCEWKRALGFRLVHSLTGFLFIPPPPSSHLYTFSFLESEWGEVPNEKKINNKKRLKNLWPKKSSAGSHT